MEPQVLPQQQVLPLIISQLSYYGFSQLAQTVADVTGAENDLPPSSKLSELLFNAKEQEERSDWDSNSLRGDEDIRSNAEETASEENDQTPRNSDPLESIGDPEVPPRSAPLYSQLYYTQHKGPCRCAAFSADGCFAATGSHDTSLKVLDVHKMNNRTGDARDASDKPVIRTLYDHMQTVNELAFHPNGKVLASCSDDMTIKLFDLGKVGVKRAFRYLQDSRAINSIDFHPSGDFLLAGTTDPEPRVYDMKTMACYTPPHSPDSAHTGSINSIRYNANGIQFATASSDGSIKVWDGVNGRCIRTIPNAHGGTIVNSVRWSRSGRFLLTAGRDSIVRLFDMNAGSTEILRYEGGNCPTQPIQATFTYNDEFVLMGDEVGYNVVVWDAKSGQLVRRVSGHNNIVRYVAASPIDVSFLSCSEDYRARYFNTGHEYTTY